ncbi:metal ABC transporter ATP-binding protein [Candidatus Sneabacter namystus]|uniref:metal ABC transporter ATP-binding protein n=1 Tax=Candidatus Sneabacter namystus TaxID=2601646 RepID=UPI00155B23BD|nr:ATP-binding cassette domain-containing protein [Candidatus Sneabacter namystus]
MKSIANVSSIKKVYGGKLVLEDVTFSLKIGQVSLLIGPNGAGKSTLSRIVLGIEKPTSGYVNASDVVFGYLPQRIHLNTSISMSSECVIKFVSGLQDIDYSIVKKLGVHAFLTDQVKELSGGQLQKLLIAAAIMRDPNVLILDEPFSDLDIESQADMHDIIQDLKKSSKMSIFITSHDLHVVAGYADQVLCLNKRLCCYDQRELQDKNFDSKKLNIYKHDH